jgi:hypothetical protein
MCTLIEYIRQESGVRSYKHFHLDCLNFLINIRNSEFWILTYKRNIMCTERTKEQKHLWMVRWKS